MVNDHQHYRGDAYATEAEKDFIKRRIHGWW